MLNMNTSCIHNFWTDKQFSAQTCSIFSISVFACFCQVTFNIDFKWNTEIKAILIKFSLVNFSENTNLIGDAMVIMIASIEVEQGLNLDMIKQNTINKKQSLTGIQHFHKNPIFTNINIHYANTPFSSECSLLNSHIER